MSKDPDTQPTPELNYHHDWTIKGTLECILAFLQARNLDCEGIHYNGEGWYQGGKDTLLIIRDEEHWKKEQWKLFGWENRDPRPIFQQLLDLENHHA